MIEPTKRNGFNRTQWAAQRVSYLCSCCDLRLSRGRSSTPTSGPQPDVKNSQLTEEKRQQAIKALQAWGENAGKEKQRKENAGLAGEQNSPAKIDRLSREAGLSSLAYYRNVVAVMNDWRSDYAKAKDGANLTRPDLALMRELKSTHERAVIRLKNLDRSGADERVLQITEQVRQCFELCQKTSEEIDPISVMLKKPETIKLLENVVAVFENMLEPGGKFDQDYHEWFMERYKIDTTADQTKK